MKIWGGESKNHEFIGKRKNILKQEEKRGGTEQ